MTKTGTKSDINADLVRKLAELLDETGLSEIEYGAEGWHVRVVRHAPPVSYAAPPLPMAPPAAAGGEPARDDLANHPGVVLSPMVGVVYTAGEPGAPPYVKAGDTVAEGDTVLLVEAMKVFNPIKAPRAGRITRILVSNGVPVEFGEPLLILE